jgi:T5SS/PEP-CTERM-associated repeat protein
MTGLNITTSSSGVVLSSATYNPVTIGPGVSIVNPSGAAIRSSLSVYWTIGNSGTLLASSAGTDGIVLAAGGAITNTQSGNIGGYAAGVSLAGSGTVVNEGSIEASQTFGSGYGYTVAGGFTALSAGVIVGGGGVSNAAAGVISSYFEGVGLNGSGSVVNAGDIAASSTAHGYGVALAKGGGVSNVANATISGGLDGVLALAAAASVTNQGVITGQVNEGVVLALGGTLSNTSSGTITGGAVGVGVFGTGTVANQGVITGQSDLGVYLYAGNFVDNLAGGTISGARSGIGSYNTASAVAATVDNQGLVAGQAGFGIYLDAGGVVSNASGGTITGARSGFASYNPATAKAAIVDNQGVINGDTEFGVYLDAGGAVTNATGGTIVGGRSGIASYNTATSDAITNAAGATITGDRFGMFVEGDALTVANSGAVSGITSVGVILLSAAPSTITNAYGGKITGGSDAIYAAGNSAAAITNEGELLGYGNDGAVLNTGGSLTNQIHGAIYAAYFGVEVANGTGTVVNAGFIASEATSSAGGVQLAAGGSVTNLSTGTISSQYIGVQIGHFPTSVSGVGYVNGPVAGSVVNQGVIYASNGYNIGAAVWIHGPGSIYNGASGTINGGPFGIVAYYATTVLNKGSIRGTEYAFDASRPGYADRVIDAPGAVFSGLVTGGNTPGSAVYSTLELASGASAGTLSGLGVQFIDFGLTTIDAGASWALNGTNSLVAGSTLINSGTLAVGGSGVGALFVQSGSVVTGTTGAALDIGAGSGGNGNVVVAASHLRDAGQVDVGEAGAGSLLIENAGTAITGGNTLAPSQGIDLGTTAGASGAITVVGTQSLLTNTGEFIVGDAGLGALAIDAGGSVITSAGTVAGLAGAIIGNTAGAVGSSVNVTGPGSDFQVTGSLLVGDAGAASLDISGGGAVSATSLDTGVVAGAAGDIQITGSTSTLTLANQLTVGDTAAANLAIYNGATVTANNADIGLNAGGSGVIDIEDAGSELNILNNINLGDAGTAVLVLGANTTLQVTNDFNIGVNGAVQGFGGLIDPTNGTNLGSVTGSHGQVITYSGTLTNDGVYLAQPGELTLNAGTILGTGTLAAGNAGDLIVNATTVVATQTVEFTNSTSFGVLTIGTLAGFSAVIGDFNAEAEIVLAGASIASDSFSNGTLTLLGAGGVDLGTLAIGGSVNSALLTVNADGGVGTVAPCFAAGTLIRTLRGEVAVEDLAVGDLLPTVLGEDAAPVVWIGRREVDCARHPEPRKVWPVRVAAGAFGVGVPYADVWLSPDHAVYVGEVLIPVRFLVNGTTIAQLKVERVTYYHVELPRHDVLLAQGLEVESYLDVKDRSDFANGPGPVKLYPDFSTRMWEAYGCAPLVAVGPELDTARRLVDQYAYVQAAA